MKKIAASFFLLALALTGCSGIPDTDFSAQTGSVYDLRSVKDDGEGPTFEKEAFALDYMTLEEEDHVIPYLSFSGYADLLAKQFDEESRSVFTVSGVNQIWQVYYKANYIFCGIFDTYQKTFSVSGSLYSAFPSGQSVLTDSSLLIDYTHTVRTLKEGAGFKNYYLRNYSFAPKRYHGNYYMPLGLLDMLFGQQAPLYHYYDLGNFYIYTSASELNKAVSPIQTLDGKQVKVGENIDSYYLQNNMPLPLRQLEKDLLYFHFDAKYGLAENKGISSIPAYFDENHIGEDMLSEDAGKRTEGFTRVISLFNELHTTLQGLGYHWGDDSSSVIPQQARTEYLETSALLKGYYEQSGIEPGSIIYSSDSKTARIGFNSFSAAMDAYKEDGTLREDAYLEDSYLYVLHQLQAIKEVGTVENVVIDISRNGGGYVLIMQKILALLSPNNLGLTYSYSPKAGGLSQDSLHLDNNHDNAYDELDVFGDDFDNIYILTSPCSFSAGNELPFFARNLGYAKTIGVNSGGGECSTEVVCFPSGRSYAYSTDNHYVYINDDQEIVYSESGAGIDVSLPYESFYDIEAIAAAIA